MSLPAHAVFHLRSACPRHLPRVINRHVSRAASRRYATAMASGRQQLALFFPGHGVQRVGMADDWVAAFPNTCKPFLEEMDHILKCPLSKIIADGPNSTLDMTENSQPAIMALSIMVLRVLEKEFGFLTETQVDVTLGHSLGEFASIVAGGFMSYEDILKITRRRAEAMARCTRQASEALGGADLGMVALVCEPDRLKDMVELVQSFISGRHEDGANHEDDLHEHDGHYRVQPIHQVSIANSNSRNQIVLSGSIPRINDVLVQLRQFGGHDPRAVRLRSDSPFHSPLMKPAMQTISEMLDKTTVNFPGRFPCISNVSARPFESADHLKDLLARQCVDTVQWWRSIKYVDQDMKVRRWVGLGPGKVGRNLVGKEVGMKGKDSVSGGGVWGISSPREIEPFLKGLEASDYALED